MKKINKNIFVFIFCAVFVISGVASSDFFGSLKENLSSALSETQSSETKETDKTDALIAAAESSYSDDLTYHDLLMNIHSLEYRVSNTEVVKKNDETVLRLSNDYLTYKSEYISDDKLEGAVKDIKALNDYCDEQGVGFLYIKAPSKGELTQTPASAFDHRKDNSDRLDVLLDEYGVSSIKLNQLMVEQGISEEDTFFVTDHHWKPEAALWAVGQVCERLNEQYGFEYNPYYNDIDNYNKKVYNDLFLGSIGKKVGLYFTKYGADDFSVITPKFETDFNMQIPQYNYSKRGNFEDTLLVKKNLEKDYYNVSCYATYSGGDYRQQIFDNKLIDADAGKKILIIRDSFGCAFTPFLALNADCIYSIDIRNTMTTEKVKSVREYIKQIDADYVLVLYNGTTLFSGQTDFN